MLYFFISVTSDFIFWYHQNLVGDTVNLSTYALFAFGTCTRTSPSLHRQTLLLGHTNIEYIEGPDKN